ncbi:protein BASIC PENTACYSTEINE7 [Sesamum alatum]|uniref:GAGA-binding transcriptional activator n=1 Tax=Sesamum alatum TaxID=300844 RepID=A0AAE2CHJ6_9LAMI|nr:protein BASIC PENTACYSTEINE7 [Sesamum alatum]
MNSNAGIAAVPIQAVGPTKKPAKRWEKKTNSSSKHKQKSFVSQTLRPKQCKNKSIGPSVEVKNPNLAHNEASLDVSGVPPPFCSCSGVARRCYKSGPGGWQSSCCTNSLSEYPLPLSPWKPGKRVSGRKMSRGPYRKLLFALAAEGHDLSQPVDLKNHWARHGTNKFVTIK